MKTKTKINKWDLSKHGGLVFLSHSEFSILHCDHTVKGFGTVNKAEVDDFLEFSHFSDAPMDVYMHIQ